MSERLHFIAAGPWWTEWPWNYVPVKTGVALFRTELYADKDGGTIWAERRATARGELREFARSPFRPTSDDFRDLNRAPKHAIESLRNEWPVWSEAEITWLRLMLRDHKAIANDTRRTA